MNGALGTNALAAIGGAIFAWLPIAFTTRPWGPTAVNRRGRRVMVVLGILIMAGVTVALLAHWVRAWVGQPDPPGWSRRQASMLGGAFLVALAGFYDDLRGDSARGLRGHFGELLRGRISPGIVKILGAVAGAGLVASVVGGGTGRLLLGILVMAGSANLWNLLDVAPGRALKYFLPIVAALVWLGWDSDFALLGAAAIGAALYVLPSDLRERGMLGDLGANVVGFIVGVGLFRVLSTWGLGIALAVILVLHVLAETVTLSRIIEATPPLRWFDRLGRLPIDQTGPESGPGSRDIAAN